MVWECRYVSGGNVDGRMVRVGVVLEISTGTWTFIGKCEENERNCFESRGQ